MKTGKEVRGGQVREGLERGLDKGKMGEREKIRKINYRGTG